MDQDEDKQTRQINMTPLVDISLTLVLVFMVTMPLSQIYGIKVKRDVLKDYGLSQVQENVVVHLTAGSLLIQDHEGKEQVVAYEDFGRVIRQLIQVSITKDFLLKVDRNVPHGQTVWALDLAKQNGAESVSIFEGGN